MTETTLPSNFIQDIIASDLQDGKISKLITRFPPEPNGYLHIGHAKSICLNFGLAQKFDGQCNLRLDDTNPEKENDEYIQAIQEDVKWLGFDWGPHLYFASDYFDSLYEYAVHLIKQGKAYVCELSPEDIKSYRGAPTEPGKESPYRNRPIAENLSKFEGMKNGLFPDGSCVLRAKIDMTSGNLNLRDPILYRIRRAHHPRTGDKWCIYPMYDFAHGQSDALEKVTHSICTLEFEDHRPLYNWFIENLPVPSKPRQFEFARLNLSYTIMSKRKLLELVTSGRVEGWDDPRMPTIRGLRRRGYTSKSVRNFAERIGVAKRDSMVDLALLEFCIREDLNSWAPRRMAVLEPLKITITNFPEGKIEELEALNNPENPAEGTRKIYFSREIVIEQSDFMENPPKKFFRLALGQEVRLRYAYFIKCEEIIKDQMGNVTELKCTYDPQTRGGNAPDGRKVKGTIHWVSLAQNFKTTVRLYEPLLTVPNPAKEEQEKSFLEYLNPNSLRELKEVVCESCIEEIQPGEHVQFERMGYFVADTKLSTSQKPVFNRTTTLKDAWANIQKKGD